MNKFIEKISKELIEYCKKTSLEQRVDDLNKWFVEQYSLPNIETGNEIASYICKNLYHYGYEVQNAYSREKGAEIFLKLIV